MRSVIERVRDSFPQTRKPRDAAAAAAVAAFPRNYCLPVTLSDLSPPMPARVCAMVSRNWNHRGAVSEISEVELIPRRGTDVSRNYLYGRRERDANDTRRKCVSLNFHGRNFDKFIEIT